MRERVSAREPPVSTTFAASHLTECMHDYIAYCMRIHYVPCLCSYIVRTHLNFSLISLEIIEASYFHSPYTTDDEKAECFDDALKRNFQLAMERRQEARAGQAGRREGRQEGRRAERKERRRERLKTFTKLLLTCATII